MSFASIVVGYDGSACAMDALETAASLCGDESVVHVVTAFDAPSIAEINALYSSVPKEFTENIDMVSTQRRPMEQAEKLLEDRGIQHKGHFLDDDPAGAILDVADKVDADLIVVGSRGLGRTSRILRGSVSSKIANHSNRSFLVVHDDD